MLLKGLIYLSRTFKLSFGGFNRKKMNKQKVLKGQIERENSFQGIARKVEWQTPSSLTVLKFRIEQVDQDGNIVRYLPVHFEGFKITGSLVDGDEVRVAGKLGEDGIYQPKKILNLKTNTFIQKKEIPKILQFLFLLIFGFIIIGSFLFVLYHMLFD